MNLNIDPESESPDYEFFKSNVSARLETFVHWNNSAVRPQDLARAGFIDLKSGDRVECVYCHGLIESWEEGDIPWEEHRRHFPRCPFINSETRGNTVPRGIDEAGTGLPPASARSRKKSVVLVSNNIIPHNFPKHPEFGSFDKRMASFGSWPPHVIIPKGGEECMAEAGLFYVGQGETDHVVCFHCGAGLKQWEENDDPWEEHARWHPNCELVLLKKGTVFVDRALKKTSASVEIKSSEPALIQGINDVHIHEPRPAHPHMAEVVTSVLHALHPESISNRTSLSSHSIVESSESTEQEFRNCVVCLMQERCITFLPCGHFTACVDCTLMLSDCPVCRQPITSVVRTYMS